MSGHLYIVATPIGNLRDITLRAIEVLKDVDLIACEDTRHTKVLLDEHSISTPTTSYHKFNIRAKTKFIVDQILAGKDVALVSDAGMPGISDPGQELVRAAVNENIRIDVIPGPSAAVAALSVSGLDTNRYVYEGFLPQKLIERTSLLEKLSVEERTIIIYEAPHRLLKTLEELEKNLGDREISIGREMTKKFEEISRGRFSDMISKFRSHKPRGEFVLVISGSEISKSSGELGEATLLVKDIVKAGLTRKDAVKIVSSRLKTSRNELYRSTLS